MYNRANKVYRILHHFFQKAYPVMNQILGKKKDTLDDSYPGKDTQLGGTYTYSKAIEEPPLPGTGQAGTS